MSTEVACVCQGLSFGTLPVEQYTQIYMYSYELRKRLSSQIYMQIYSLTFSINIGVLNQHPACMQRQEVFLLIKSSIFATQLRSSTGSQLATTVLDQLVQLEIVNEVILQQLLPIEFLHIKSITCIPDNFLNFYTQNQQIQFEYICTTPSTLMHCDTRVDKSLLLTTSTFLPP